MNYKLSSAFVLILVLIVTIFALIGDEKANELANETSLPTKDKSNIDMSDKPVGTLDDVTVAKEHAEKDIKTDNPPGSHRQTSPEDNVSVSFEKIRTFASEKKWNELLEIAYDLQDKNSELVDIIFLESAKSNAPNHFFSALANLGASLPDNAVNYLIGASNISTLETLRSNYGLNLKYTHPVTGNAFSQAVASNADLEVFEYLISAGATLEQPGRFEPVQDLIEKAIISGDLSAVSKVEKLIKFGAKVTDKHYEYAYKYRNYRPELFQVVTSHYSSKPPGNSG